MEIDLASLLRGHVDVLETEVEETAARIYGVTLGVVTSVDDDKHLGRIRVRLPLLSGHVETGWVRIATEWAGAGRGSHFPPAVDDEVLVAFRDGDVKYPYVLGFLSSETRRPPAALQERPLKGLWSASGSVVVFDESRGKESVTVRSPAGLEVCVDDGAKQVRIADRDRAVQILVSTSGSGEIAISATKGNLKLEAPAGEVTIKGRSVRVEASTGLKLIGHPIDLNPPF